MKNLIFSMVCFLVTVFTIIFSSAQAQQKYIITGTVKGLSEPMKLMLQYRRSKTEEVKDSVLVKNGRFTMEGIIDHPCFATIILKPIHAEAEAGAHAGKEARMTDMQSFFLADGVTTVVGNNLREAVIHNPVQDEFLALKAATKALEGSSLELDRKLFSAKSTDSVAIWQAKKAEIERQYIKAHTQFVKDHPNSYVSFDLVKNYGIVISDPVSFEAMYSALSPSFKNTPEGKRMGEDLSMVKQLALGQQAIDFNQNDLNGKPFQLSSLKGKYVLIDFWASWCGPCRAEYPYLHQAYDRYKERFEIVGVSLDDNKELWINAIHENKFEWTEVSDLKGRNNEVARLYGISAIPQNFLVDPQGMIIAKNLRGEELMKKLDEVIEK